MKVIFLLGFLVLIFLACSSATVATQVIPKVMATAGRPVIPVTSDDDFGMRNPGICGSERGL